MTPALRLEHVSVGPTRGPIVLSDICLEVRPGEVVALVGANGSGKTSLLRTIAGLTPARAGRLYLGDEEAPARPAARASRGIALSFQTPDDQLFGATVAEDVAIGPSHQGLPRAEIQARVTQALEATGLTLLAERPIDALSFGEKKRACLAGVLAMAPSVLLLDEPTAGLDPVREREAMALIRRLARNSGVAALVATHAVDELPYLADRVAVLGQGKLLAFADTAAVLADVETLGRAELRVPALVELWLALGALERGGLLPGELQGPPPLTPPQAAQALAALLAPPRPRRVGT